MEYSIYFLLVLIYSLMGIIGFKVWRIMAREERALLLPRTAQKPRETESDLARSVLTELGTPEGVGRSVHAGSRMRSP
jgi:hypothetical protein